jgi:hypothetical protein
MSLRIYQPSDLRRLLKGYQPGWFSNKGGGSGGGLASVSHDATLSGLGTAGTPLKIAGGAVPGFSTGFPASTSSAVTANKLVLNSVFIPSPTVFANIAVAVSAADAVNNCDLGLYDATGAMVANIGAQPIAATGRQSFATVQGVKTIGAGLYYFAFTSNAAVLVLLAGNGVLTPYFLGTFGASAGGALPANITPPANNFDQYPTQFTLL